MGMWCASVVAEICKRAGIRATHRLKITGAYFWDVRSGAKQFELRRDDRGYQVGDRLVLREWIPLYGFTGNQVRVVVTYLVRGGEFGLAPGYVALGIRVIRRRVPGFRSFFKKH